MKKFLLSCMMLLGMGVAAYADDVTTYEPGDPFTDVESLLTNQFAMVQGEKALYVADAQNLAFDEFTKAFSATNAAVYYKLIEVPSEQADAKTTGSYLIRTYTLAGDEYHTWGDGNNGFLNSQDAGGWCSFVISAGANGHKLRQDIDYGAVWTVEYVDTKGFTLKNVGTGLYLNNAGTAGNTEPAYWNFCKLNETTITNPIEKGAYDATDANTTFFSGFKAIADGATYDAETKIFKGNCGWQWAEGADFDKYQYIVITVAENVLNKGCQVHIKDASGLEVKGDEYGASFMNMWIGAWNNHNCLKIDLEKLRTEKMFDIHHVTEILIEAGDGLILGNAYATNHVPENNKNWNDEEKGDYKLTIDNNKFATICLPFEASVAGAYVYEIAGKGDGFISLSMYNGILTAGKPYIVKSNVNESGNIYFYKATANTAAEAGENNGLIGTFAAIEKVAAGSVVLNGNKLYTVNSDVALAANKAYIDLTKISGNASRGSVILNFDEITGIETVKTEMSENSIFNLNGQRLAQPKKGLNIIGGKKEMMK